MTTDSKIGVAVLMDRIAAPNRWEDWGFRLVEVIPDALGESVSTPRLVETEGSRTRWLHPGFTLELFPDECKGYFLNLTSGRPAWFVSWMPSANDTSQIDITSVSVSYIEADRRMFAEERVENVALQPELCEWLRLYTNQHFKPEGQRKVRAQSFLSPQERDAKRAAPDAGSACDV